MKQISGGFITLPALLDRQDRHRLDDVHPNIERSAINKGGDNFVIHNLDQFLDSNWGLVVYGMKSYQNNNHHATPGDDKSI
jgi:hypothetical protein